MKQLLLLSVIASTLLSHEYEDYYEKADYEKAYTLAQKECDVDCSDINLNFIIANSAKELQDYEQAMLAYERVLFLDEDNEEAKYSLEEIKAILYKDSKPKHYFIGFNYSIGFDTNPKYGNNKTIYYYNSQNKLVADKLSKQPSAFNMSSSIFSGYTLELDEDNLINFDGSLYLKHFLKPKSQDYSNIAFTSLSIMPVHNFDNSSISLSLSYNYIAIKYKSSINELQARLGYFTSINDFYKIGLFYSLSKGLYIQDEDKNDNYISHSFRINNILEQDKLTYYLGLNFINKYANNSINSNSDYFTCIFSPSINYVINDIFDVDFGSDFGISKYKKLNPEFKSKRKDFNIYAYTSLNHKLSKHSSLSYELSNDYISSNQDENDSVNTSVKLSYRFIF